MGWLLDPTGPIDMTPGSAVRIVALEIAIEKPLEKEEGG
jgi:hypothetical protein